MCVLSINVSIQKSLETYLMILVCVYNLSLQLILQKLMPFIHFDEWKKVIVLYNIVSVLL